MPQPSTDVDSLFADLLPVLPPETAQMTREFKVCTCSAHNENTRPMAASGPALRWILICRCGLVTCEAICHWCLSFG